MLIRDRIKILSKEYCRAKIQLSGVSCSNQQCLSIYTIQYQSQYRIKLHMYGNVLEYYKINEDDYYIKENLSEIICRIEDDWCMLSAYFRHRSKRTLL